MSVAHIRARPEGDSQPPSFLAGLNRVDTSHHESR